MRNINFLLIKNRSSNEEYQFFREKIVPRMRNINFLLIKNRLYPTPTPARLGSHIHRTTQTTVPISIGTAGV